MFILLKWKPIKTYSLGPLFKRNLKRYASLELWMSLSLLREFVNVMVLG